MIHSACISFNKINIISYLDNCWELINNVKPEFSFSTVLHLCSAHIMYRISYNIDKRALRLLALRGWKTLSAGGALRAPGLTLINYKGDNISKLCLVRVLIL